MAIYVADLRTFSMKRRQEGLRGFYPHNACELCRKPIKEGAEMMARIDHECYEFVTNAEAEARGDAVSLFPVGADCYRKIQRALADH